MKQLRSSGPIGEALDPRPGLRVDRLLRELGELREMISAMEQSGQAPDVAEQAFRRIAADVIEVLDGRAMGLPQELASASNQPDRTSHEIR